MRSGGVLLKKEKDPEDVSLLRFTHAVFSFLFFFFYDSDSLRHGKREEWGEGINRCRGELENSALKDFLKCVFVSLCVWAIHGGLKEHFKEPSDGCLALSMCFWGRTHLHEMNSAFKHYSSCVLCVKTSFGAGGSVNIKFHHGSMCLYVVVFFKHNIRIVLLSYYYYYVHYYYHHHIWHKFIK